MKKCTYTYILMTAMLLLATLAVVAATEQWRYDGWSRILQVVADGSGGVAFFRLETNGVAASIVWLDKKGALVYESANMLELIGPIISCTKKELIFTRGEGNPPNRTIILVQVDSKGNEQTITEPGKYLVGPAFQFGQGISKDKKGFFAEALTTNSPYRTELIRYTYK